MASVCGSGKSHPALSVSSYYRPSPYPYQVSFQIIIIKIIINKINMCFKI